MSAPKFLKCPCHQCGGPIEFPAHGIGVAAVCPHCGQKTTLFAPRLDPVPAQLAKESSPSPTVSPASLVPREQSAPASPSLPDASQATPSLDVEESESRPSTKVFRAAAVILALAVASGAFWVLRTMKAAVKSAAPAANAAAGGVQPRAATNPLPEPASDSAVPVLTAKSIEDLKVGPIRLERTQGSSLVYAVGVLKNDSEHRRFAIHLELELSDNRGNKAGLAKDYRAVLEPRQEWRFHALVLDSKATSARVARILEE